MSRFQGAVRTASPGMILGSFQGFWWGANFSTSEGTRRLPHGALVHIGEDIATYELVHKGLRRIQTSSGKPQGGLVPLVNISEDLQVISLP
ncbi:MAG: hypothetical protein COV34_01255 [Candidatus Zambryskibacteria bacterium CG10_big_fil_rev_8_21_14_0_10_42_12]|uniref:Uncharacterized protein n=1 Tax=Candidatus Zambryskibacteria bacterium CG10_big_fil_rev_8_21_14_0_10_42_12 TaxID=1975115 RepID=A0A2H0QWN5_9BACT|nr:MAG: hypothetical protein COV34_01255 [Candidatus Zambryskibacteria bacterium CG10_big_fil_rev_8_21_14_0_10_42_12]